MGERVRDIRIVGSDEALIAAARTAVASLPGWEVHPAASHDELVSEPPQEGDVLLLDSWLRGPNVYELCRSLGFQASQIVFNGPHKTSEELTRALGEGALVTVDHFAELEQIEQIARTLSSPARIGMRISFQYGAAPWTKFGFSDDNGDSQRALERIARNRRLRLELLHNHCGTFVLLHSLYAMAAERLINLAKRARALRQSRRRRARRAARAISGTLASARIAAATPAMPPP